MDAASLILDRHRPARAARRPGRPCRCGDPRRLRHRRTLPGRACPRREPEVPVTRRRPTWDDLAAADPALAAAARSLLERSGTGEGLLASVRGDQPPRIHPVNVAIVDGRLLTVVLAGSAKAATSSPTAATRSTPTRTPPSRTSSSSGAARSRSRIPPSAPAPSRAGPSTSPRTPTSWSSRIDHALLGERADPDAWPPVYRSVRPPARSTVFESPVDQIRGSRAWVERIPCDSGMSRAAGVPI